MVKTFPAVISQVMETRIATRVRTPASAGNGSNESVAERCWEQGVEASGFASFASLAISETTKLIKRDGHIPWSTERLFRARSFRRIADIS